MRFARRLLAGSERFGFRAFRFGQVAFAVSFTTAIAFLLGGDRRLEPAGAAEPSVAQSAPSTSVRARQLYEVNCAVCHGVEGAGDGPAAAMFITRPRDFRAGVFKFRSTPSGSLPTDDDLLRTITHGLRWTAMIARADLSEAERRALVQNIKKFSSRFAEETPSKRIRLTARPARTGEAIAVGERLFRDAGCDSCHGSDGRGNGPPAAQMRDDWGWPIKPGDLTWRPLKRGAELEQIYLTIAAGVSGTPMPAFGESLDPPQLWAIVYFLESLVPPERRLPPERLLGEEQQARMVLHMGGMMGRSRGPFR